MFIKHAHVIAFGPAFQLPLIVVESVQQETQKKQPRKYCIESLCVSGRNLTKTSTSNHVCLVIWNPCTKQLASFKQDCLQKNNHNWIHPLPIAAEGANCYSEKLRILSNDFGHKFQPFDTNICIYSRSKLVRFKKAGNVLSSTIVFGFNLFHATCNVHTSLYENIVTKLNFGKKYVEPDKLEPFPEINEANESGYVRIWVLWLNAMCGCSKNTLFRLMETHATANAQQSKPAWECPTVTWQLQRVSTNHCQWHQNTRKDGTKSLATNITRSSCRSLIVSSA